MSLGKLLVLYLTCIVLRVYCQDTTKKDYYHRNHVDRAKLKDSENDTEGNCWITLHAKKHFEKMDALDAKYAETLQKFHEIWKDQNLDDDMLKATVSERAGAERAVVNAGSRSMIPAGINLGAYIMLHMPTSLLFFHRLKLRNQTYFEVRYLDSNLVDMTLTARFGLNDLHLNGTYMRSVVESTSYNQILYQPAIGHLGLLLKNVRYQIEGRYRFVQDRLMVEHIISNKLKIDDVLMTTGNGTECGADDTTERLPNIVTDVLVETLQADLDTWVKDYFNDYLLKQDLKKLSASIAPKLNDYEKQKLELLNNYVDLSLAALKWRLHSMKPRAADVKISDVIFRSNTGVRLDLDKGVIRGIDSFYRTSVATERKDEKGIRNVAALIAFHRLKVEYRYVATIPGMPTLYGLIVLSADDLFAQLEIKLVKGPNEAADVNLKYYRSPRPESLVIGGSLNRWIANFEYILKDQLMSVLINKLRYQINLLGTLTRCDPLLVGHEDPGDASSEIKDPVRSGHPILLTRNDSIELQLPSDSDDAAAEPKKLHVKYAERLEVDDVNDKNSNYISEQEARRGTDVDDNISEDGRRKNDRKHPRREKRH